jgi:hypothetical protein
MQDYTGTLVQTTTAVIRDEEGWDDTRKPL